MRCCSVMWMAEKKDRKERKFKGKSGIFPMRSSACPREILRETLEKEMTYLTYQKCFAVFSEERCIPLLCQC